MANLVKKGPEDDQDDQETRSPGDAPEVGRWYWVTETDGKGKVQRLLRCVVHIGSNFVKLEGPSGTSDEAGSVSSIRIHFDEFWTWCEHAPDPDLIIDGEIEKHKQQSRELMHEVRALTALLGVAPRQEIADGQQDEVQALSIRSSEPTDKYKKALVKAKTKTLPDLFEKLKESNKKLGQWMRVKLIPMAAEAEALKGVVGLVEDRIFSVELYAGLVEEVKLVKDGAPADNDAKVHLMQRRCYMDEECLVGYEHGGMDYKDIEDFECWLTKPANFARVLPFPRTLVAFKVRREKKDRVVTLASFIRVMAEQDADEQTFLYIRNGERLYRMQTELEFEEKLFPDTNHKLFTSTKLWSKWAGSSSIDDIISDEELQGIIDDEKLDAAEKAKLPKADRWKHSDRHFHHSSSYTAFTPASVYYDDIAKLIAKEKKKHNRLVLIMQGLLDRSPVLHPHPPYQLWTPEGFGAAFKLIYDDTRALSAGDKPDFEAYRAKLNSFLTSGSLTVGQETSWLLREADRENERRANMHSFGSSSSYDRADLVTYKPDGDPGPGKLAHVARYDAKEGRCTYAWTRQKRTRNGWAVAGTEVPGKLTTGEENVLNIDAYRPGDFHIFFDDPRTRREYLEWAPLLLEAEECHAGNRKEFKPARALPPQRTPVVRTEERPVDLDVPKKREPKESLEEKWKGRKVRLRRAMETKGGTKFKEGELMEVNYYHRRKLDMSSLENEGKGIHSVSVDDVYIAGENE